MEPERSWGILPQGRSFMLLLRYECSNHYAARRRQMSLDTSDV
jgi:hypothetical protein